jgi:hypothetical protein
LIAHRYVMLLPLAIVEGPVLAVIAGLLCTQGFLTPFIVYPLIIAGDMIGDSICYWLGRAARSGRFNRFWLTRRLGNRLGGNREKLDRLMLFFDENQVKTVSLSKITLGVGAAGIAGALLSQGPVSGTAAHRNEYQAGFRRFSAGRYSYPGPFPPLQSNPTYGQRTGYSRRGDESFYAGKSDRPFAFCEI